MAHSLSLLRRRQPDVLEAEPAQLLARVLQLRALLPTVDLPELIQRRPRLLTQACLLEPVDADFAPFRSHCSKSQSD